MSSIVLDRQDLYRYFVDEFKNYMVRKTRKIAFATAGLNLTI